MLQATGTIDIPVLPFGYFGEPLCDSNGNLFFHRDTGQLGDIDIFRISGSGDDTTSYRLDDERGARYNFHSFAVSPSGNVFIFAQDLKGAYVVIDFAADGTVRAESTLDTPKNLDVRNFGIFDDGAALISGSFNGRASARLTGRNYVAIYEPSGKLRVHLKRFDTTSLSNIGPQVTQGSVAIGRDGFAYFLFGREVAVVSGSGEIVRRIKFAGPRFNGFATRLNISGGLLVVTISRDGTDSTITREYLILDASTGEQLGHYTAGPELQNQDACFNESEGFTFLTSDGSQHLKRVTAQAR